jgi:hypothetical protein
MRPQVYSDGKHPPWWYTKGAPLIFFSRSMFKFHRLQDLVARDYHISHQLREQAATLPDIVLTEVAQLTLPF